MHCDYLIQNAKIIDGSGAPWFLGDVAIVKDRIAFVGTLRDRSIPPAERATDLQPVDGAQRTECTERATVPQKVMADVVIDAKGKVLAPGFIDSHTHMDLAPFPFYPAQDPQSVRRLQQGITTQITGCCGITAAKPRGQNGCCAPLASSRQHRLPGTASASIWMPLPPGLWASITPATWGTVPSATV